MLKADRPSRACGLRVLGGCEPIERLLEPMHSGGDIDSSSETAANSLIEALASLISRQNFPVPNLGKAQLSRDCRGGNRISKGRIGGHLAGFRCKIPCLQGIRGGDTLDPHWRPSQAVLSPDWSS